MINNRYNTIILALVLFGLGAVVASLLRIHSESLDPSIGTSPAYYVLAGGIFCLATALVMFLRRKEHEQVRLEEEAGNQTIWDAGIANIGTEDIVSEFRRRRKRLIPWSLGPLVLAILCIAFSAVGGTSDKGAPGKVQIVAIGLAFVFMAFSIAFLSVTYRCPVCSRPPWVRMAGGKTGVSLNPALCPSCGARLRGDED
jgi:hypothetical protein